MLIKRRKNKILMSLALLVACQTALGYLKVDNPDALLEAKQAYDNKMQGGDQSYVDSEKADEFRMLLDSGAVDHTLTVKEDFLEAYQQIDRETPHLIQSMTTAYVAPDWKADKTVSYLVRLSYAMSHGVQVNEAIEEAKEKYREVLEGVAKALDFAAGINIGKKGFPKHFKPLVKVLNQSDGLVLAFNQDKHDLFKMLPVVPGNEEMDTHVDFVSQSKCSSSLKGDLSPAFLGRGFEQLAEKNKDLFLDCMPFPQNLENKRVAQQVIESVLQYATTTPGAAYFLAFKGESKYQFFTVSVYQEHLNIAFAVDDSDPAPVLILSLPLGEVSHEKVSKAIESAMNQKGGRDLVPDLVGFWRMASRRYW